MFAIVEFLNIFHYPIRAHIVAKNPALAGVGSTMVLSHIDLRTQPWNDIYN